MNNSLTYKLNTKSNTLDCIFFNINTLVCSDDKYTQKCTVFFDCSLSLNNLQIDLIKNKDITWALQNIQSNNNFKKLIANHILNN